MTGCVVRGAVRHTANCGVSCSLILLHSTAPGAVSAAAADAQLLAAAVAGVQLPAVAAAAAAAAAETCLTVAAAGTGDIDAGTSLGLLGSWRTVAGRRGHAWGGAGDAVGRAP